MQHQVEGDYGGEGPGMNSSSSFFTANGLRRFSKWNLGYTLAVILWGAYVRATGSGAGCGEHWPLCNGVVIPRAERLQTVIEFLHRATSGISLSLTALGVLWAWKASRPGALIRKVAVLSGVAILLEALLGAALVLLKLVEFDQSAARAVSISLHLANTLFLLATLTTLVFASAEPANFERRKISILPRSTLFWGALAGFVILGMSGAVTALGDTLFPAKDLLTGVAQDFVSGAHFLLRLRVIHPLVATGWIVLGFLWSQQIEERELIRLRSGLIGLMILQFLIGFLNWILLAPNLLQLLHLLVADLIFIVFWMSGLEYEARKSRQQT